MKLRLQFNSIRLRLIEKDLACIDGTEEQNFDTFPHTVGGTKQLVQTEVEIAYER